jgi:hypothetical protein
VKMEGWSLLREGMKVKRKNCFSKSGNWHIEEAALKSCSVEVCIGTSALPNWLWTRICEKISQSL